MLNTFCIELSTEFYGFFLLGQCFSISYIWFCNLIAAIESKPISNFYFSVRLDYKSFKKSSGLNSLSIFAYNISFKVFCVKNYQIHPAIKFQNLPILMNWQLKCETVVKVNQINSLYFFIVPSIHIVLFLCLDSKLLQS